MRGALVRFTAGGLLALVVVGVATVFVARAVSMDVALRQAKHRGTTFAQVVSAPLVGPGVRQGRGEDLQEFSEIMYTRLKDKSMVHIKVWDPDGRIIWADTRGMRGKVFPLEPAVARLFETGGAVASLSDLESEENELEAPEAPLFEVYAAADDAEGNPILVETYWSTAEIDDDARAIMVRLAPLSLGALLLFAAVLGPLAWTMARRVERAQAESKKSLQHALSASDLERRRIARDLHDGVMQDVSGAGYALAVAARTLPPDAETPRRLIQEVSGVVKQVGESLRSLLADIYPPNLARDGLAAAVKELAHRAEKEGVSVTVEVAEGDLDDGRGLPAEPAPGEHHGLRLLEDTLMDFGGSLSVRSRAGGGTLFSATVPLQVAVHEPSQGFY